MAEPWDEFEGVNWVWCMSCGNRKVAATTYPECCAKNVPYKNRRSPSEERQAQKSKDPDNGG